MATTQSVTRLGRFLVELAHAADGYGDIRALAERVQSASRDLTRQGTIVRFLRSVYLPEDGTCLLLFDASSAEVVAEAGRRASLRVGPVCEVTRVAATAAATATGGER